jgi:hypothetical protein
MEWEYNGKEFKTLPIDWYTLYDSAAIPMDELICDNRVSHVEYKGDSLPVVYQTDWDKCLILMSFRYAGNRYHKLSAWVRDIYNPDVAVVTSVDKLELVVVK